MRFQRGELFLFFFFAPLPGASKVPPLSFAASSFLFFLSANIPPEIFFWTDGLKVIRMEACLVWEELLIITTLHFG